MMQCIAPIDYEGGKLSTAGTPPLPACRLAAPCRSASHPRTPWCCPQTLQLDVEELFASVLDFDIGTGDDRQAEPAAGGGTTAAALEEEEQQQQQQQQAAAPPDSKKLCGNVASDQPDLIGLDVWPASIALCQYLSAAPALVAGAAVCELGAGAQGSQSGACPSRVRWRRVRWRIYAGGWGACRQVVQVGGRAGGPVGLYVFLPELCQNSAQFRCQARVSSHHGS